MLVKAVKSGCGCICPYFEWQEGSMKFIITSKNVKVRYYLKETIEKKFQKLDKYFADDIDVNVRLSAEKNWEKMEATIRIKGTVFRAEAKGDAAYDCIEKVVDKLATQMSRFKDRLVKKHKGQPGLKFEEWPEVAEQQDAAPEIKIVKDKKFNIEALTPEEAIVQMELIGHNFFMFINSETKAVNVVYKRDGGDYGLLEATY